METRRKRQRISRLLIVEDDESQLRSLTAVMESEGFEVVGCSNASDALERLRLLDVGVAILDLQLGDMSGMELLQRLNAYSDRVRLIINTAYSSYGTAKEALNLGAFAYVEKAGDPDELVRHVHRAFKAGFHSYAEELEKTVSSRTRELRRANHLLEQEIAERKEAEQKILEHEAQLRSLASELTLSEERQRRHIARELHDEIGQNLALVKLRLQTLAAGLTDAPVLGQIDDICDVLDGLLEAAHSLTFQLSNLALYEFDFETAVEQWLDEEVRSRHGIDCRLTSGPEPVGLDDTLKITLFQAVRELAVNVVKHAAAQTLRIDISESGGVIRITVEDDGVGFDPSAVSPSVSDGKMGGFGIFNVRERVQYVGGDIDIQSAPGSGTRITITVPLRCQETTSIEQTQV